MPRPQCDTSLVNSVLHVLGSWPNLCHPSLMNLLVLDHVHPTQLSVHKAKAPSSLLSLWNRKKTILQKSSLGGGLQKVNAVMFFCWRILTSSKLMENGTPIGWKNGMPAPGGNMATTHHCPPGAGLGWNGTYTGTMVKTLKFYRLLLTIVNIPSWD